jgi:hypothetical protein
MKIFKAKTVIFESKLQRPRCKRGERKDLSGSFITSIYGLTALNSVFRPSSNTPRIVGFLAIIRPGGARGKGKSTRQ